MQKLLPWTATAILATTLVGVTVYYRDALSMKEGELQVLREASAQAANAAEVKLKAAEERIASTATNAAERLAAAKADAAASAAERVAAVKVEAQEAASQASAKAQEAAEQARLRMDSMASEARARLQAASLPETTVAIIFRKAIVSNGNVAMVKNISGSSSIFSLLVGRPSTNQNRQFSPVIDAGKVMEIGEREGWAFLAGDVVRVSQPGHKPKEFFVR